MSCTFNTQIEKEATPPPAAKKEPYRKSTVGTTAKPPVEEKKEEVEQGDIFKMPKKKAAPRKVIQKEEEQPAFAGMKLKKSERVQRKWDEPGLETVELKHHDFEIEPEEESVGILQ